MKIKQLAFIFLLSTSLSLVSCEEPTFYTTGEIIKIENLSGTEFMKDFAQYNYIVHFKSDDGQLYMKYFISTGYKVNDKIKIDINNGWRSE